MLNNAVANLWYGISAQRGDKKGERGQQRMKVNENEEINQACLDERVRSIVWESLPFCSYCY